MSTKNYSKQQVNEMRNALRNLLHKLPAIAFAMDFHSYNELVSNDTMLNELLIKKVTGITRQQIAQLFNGKDMTMLDYEIEDFYKTHKK